MRASQVPECRAAVWKIASANFVPAPSMRAARSGIRLSINCSLRSKSTPYASPIWQLPPPSGASLRSSSRGETASQTLGGRSVRKSKYQNRQGPVRPESRASVFGVDSRFLPAMFWQHSEFFDQLVEPDGGSFSSSISPEASVILSAFVRIYIWSRSEGLSFCPDVNPRQSQVARATSWSGVT